MKLIAEEKLKEVITTKYVVENNSPIISVFYDEDGDWQFFGDEECSEEDALVISIQQILDIDKTLVNLPDMEKGHKAYRINKKSKWELAKIN
jgi:hypothetical protein